ncbi:hypothetical protein FIBSPDRAFT_657822, partial [Athelia psychrophila]
MFLTDMLFSSPQMKFSQAQQMAVLAWGKELHAEDVPSQKKFLAAQQDLLSKLRDPTEQQESSRGNVYYLNDIGASISKIHTFCSNLSDMSNPISQPDMVFYPEDGEGRLSEVWHGEKMLGDVPDGLLSPTLCHKGQVY